MAHLCSVYPFHVDAGFGERGVLMGANVTGGFAGFFFDPFEFYAQRHLTNPNMIVMGSVGFGKSATVKAFLRRLKAVYGAGRYLAIIDPKGEYGPVAADLGLAVVKPAPGRLDRINPMDPGGGDGDDSVIARQSLAAHSSPACSAGDLTPSKTPCWAGRSSSAAAPDGRSRCATCAAEILDPPDELVRLSRHTPLELARATAPVAFALDKLCSPHPARHVRRPHHRRTSTGTTAPASCSTCPPSTATPKPCRW